MLPEDLDQVVVLGRSDGLEVLPGVPVFSPSWLPVMVTSSTRLASTSLMNWLKLTSVLTRLGDWRRLQRRMMITPAEIQKSRFFIFLFFLRGIIFFLLSGPILALSSPY
jgi:hypothetical protein